MEKIYTYDKIGSIIANCTGKEKLGNVLFNGSEVIATNGWILLIVEARESTDREEIKHARDTNIVNNPNYILVPADAVKKIGGYLKKELDFFWLADETENTITLACNGNNSVKIVTKKVKTAYPDIETIRSKERGDPAITICLNTGLLKKIVEIFSKASDEMCIHIYANNEPIVFEATRYGRKITGFMMAKEVKQ